MIYKIKYKNITFNNLSEKDFPNLMNGDGLFTFPAAPPLATLELNSEYHKSLISSDYVFFDSGYFVLLLRYLKGIKVDKFSGYKFLKLLFKFLNFGYVKRFINNYDDNGKKNGFENFYRDQFFLEISHKIKRSDFNLKLKNQKLAQAQR